MGLAQAERLERVGPAGSGRAFGLGPFQKDKICFFSIFLMRKQFQKNLEIV
jgi:hypothetical protein